MRNALRVSLAALVASLLAASPATARPLTVEEDVSDNVFSFTYDATDGDLERASSTRILRRNDRVAFLLYVRERAGAELGARLTGRIELELLASRARRYRGTFSVQITDAVGEVVLTVTDRANVLLRPKKGQRTEVLRIRFDLPSGDYGATATFTAS